VKLVDPGGVAAVVLMVNVEVFVVSLVAKETELGVNDAVAPVGRAVVKLRFAENAPLAPRVTVTA
jgi:hypothetical protein